MDALKRQICFCGMFGFTLTKTVIIQQYNISVNIQTRFLQYLQYCTVHIDVELESFIAHKTSISV